MPMQITVSRNRKVSENYNSEAERRLKAAKFPTVKTLESFDFTAQAMGYARQDDQDTLAHDVAMKLSVWDRGGDRVIEERLASQPSDWRLIDRLSTRPNRGQLREALAWWVGRHQRATGRGRGVRRGTLDIDPFPIEVHGKQPGGAYHGYYKKTIYQPLVASFSAEGEYDAARLGEGFVHAILRRGHCGGAEGMVRFTREANGPSYRLQDATQRAKRTPKPKGDANK